MVAGVCGGLAGWLGWDATVVRVLFLVFAAVSHLAPALLVYGILWMVIPEERRATYRILEPWEDLDDL
jgi:phage shock protein PspC (stress-responsive transcriptional regulator)